MDRGRLVGVGLRVLATAVLGMGTGLLGASLRGGGGGVTPAVYTVRAPCASCAASLSSVQVQSRPDGDLFIARGRLPTTASSLRTSVRLQADGLDVTLRPDGAGGFALAQATLDGAPAVAGTVSAGVQDGAFLVMVRSGVLSHPVRFAMGTWNGSRYTSRIPARGSLLWKGAGRPSQSPTAPGSAPGDSASAWAVTALADSCPQIPFGAVPDPLTLGTLSSGRSADPRSQAVTPSVALRYAAPLVQSFKTQGPFAVVVAIATPGIPTDRGGVPVDRLGSTQLWAVWDGTTLAKAVRHFDGHQWTTLENAAAEPLTIEVNPTGVQFWWPTLRPSELAGAVLAVHGACAATGLGPNGAPAQALTGVG
jgi:hypothetical protein